MILDERDAPVGAKVAFPWILNQLGIVAGANVLDVGAGGLNGKNTTVFLCQLQCKITAVELDKARSDTLKETFPEIKTINSDVRLYDHDDGPFDLVIYDLDTALMHFVVQEMLPASVAHLRPGGYFITMLIYDLAGTYDGEPSLLPIGGRLSQQVFMRECFGSERIGHNTAELLAKQHGLLCIGVVDKFLGNHRHGRGVGWLIMRKPPAELLCP